MTYRDDDAADALRLGQLDEEIARREARFTPVFWERVAPRWGLARTMVAGSEPRTDRERRLEALDDALRRARGGPFAAPRLPPPDRPEGFLADLARTMSFEPHRSQEALEVARSFAEDAELSQKNSSQWFVRFTAKGAPVEIMIERYMRNKQVSLQAELITTVCPAAELSLKQEGILQDLLEMVGLGKEIEIGDPNFDPVYLIKGDEATARAWLTVDARRVLTAHDLAAAPSLTVRDGFALFRTLDVEKKTLTRLTTLLAEWHAAPPPAPLVVEEDPEASTPV